MDFTQDNSKLKDISYKGIYDKKSKMSGRIACAFIYAAVRTAEIIDWWFPIKVEPPLKTQ
jgi:hypothetical protein